MFERESSAHFKFLDEETSILEDIQIILKIKTLLKSNIPFGAIYKLSNSYRTITKLYNPESLIE
jgi:hypothetical protein